MNPADERDAREEMTADGYRVMIVGPGRRVSAYDLDQATASEAFTWARENSQPVPSTESSDGVRSYAVAARWNMPGGGVSLVWLTPSADDVMERLTA